MFGIFKKKNDNRPEENYSQAVILEVPLDSGQDLGSNEEHEAIFTLEDKLSTLINKSEVVDGHDFGEGTAIVYLYGPSADVLFDKVKDALKRSAFSRFEVTLRYGPAEDKDSEEKRFTLS